MITLADRASADEIDPAVVKAAPAQLNYVLGITPLRKSYVTGYGVDDPKQIFSSIYSSDGIAALPRGILAEGPNQYQGSRCSRFLRQKCYADTNTDWTVSEHAIYYNANLVFVLALAEATSGRSWPTRPRHRCRSRLGGPGLPRAAAAPRRIAPKSPCFRVWRWPSVATTSCAEEAADPARTTPHRGRVRPRSRRPVRPAFRASRRASGGRHARRSGRRGRGRGRWRRRPGEHPSSPRRRCQPCGCRRPGAGHRPPWSSWPRRLLERELVPRYFDRLVVKCRASEAPSRSPIRACLPVGRWEPGTGHPRSRRPIPACQREDHRPPPAPPYAGVQSPSWRHACAPAPGPISTRSYATTSRQGSTTAMPRTMPATMHG